MPDTKTSVQVWTNGVGTGPQDLQQSCFPYSHRGDGIPRVGPLCSEVTETGPPFPVPVPTGPFPTDTVTDGFGTPSGPRSLSQGDQPQETPRVFSGVHWGLSSS